MAPNAGAPRLDLDKVGTVASTICAVHCLLSGIALGLISVLGIGFIGNPLVDYGFILVALVVGIFAIRSGYKIHGSYTPAIIFCAAVIMIAIAHLVLKHQHVVGRPLDIVEYASTTFAVLGGLSLVTFHVVNRRLIAATKCQCSACKTEAESAVADVSGITLR